VIDVGSGTHLWSRVAGDGPGTVLVPTNGNGAEWAGLDGPGRRVVQYDVRGRGRSDEVPDGELPGLAGHVADLEAVRVAVGAERFSAVAASWTAAVVVSYALAHPGRVERLVLVSPVPCHSGGVPDRVPPPAPHRLAALDQLGASGLKRDDPVAYARAWRETYVPPLLGDASAFERMADVAPLPNEWPWHVAKALVPVFAGLLRYDWRPDLWAVGGPVLVVRGGLDRDPQATASEWVDALPAATLLVVDGAGRMPWVECPDEFFAAANRFLAG
jgi:proline iminopeptidase